MAATERVARLHSGQADEVNERLQDAAGRYSRPLIETAQWMMEPIAKHRPRNAQQVLHELRTIERASATRSQPTSTHKTPLPADFKATPALTQALQNTLEKHAGTIARKVVPRAISTASSYDELVNHLAGFVLNPEQELEFRERAASLPVRPSEASTELYQDDAAESGARSQSPYTRTRSKEAGAATGLQAEVLTNAHGHLAQYVGPIAAVLIEEAAAQTTDATRFHALLADEIDDSARARSRKVLTEQ